MILVFFTSWSKSCQTELKDLQAYYTTDNHPSVEVVAVSFDKKQKDVKKFAAENEITFPILLDKKLTSLDNFQILIIPTTFCINQEGLIEKIFVDYDDNVKASLIP